MERLLHRREGIILTAIEVINELGVQGLSIREVAKRQEMSNAALFNHFKSKTDLLLAVLDHYTHYDNAILQNIRSRGFCGKNAIIYCVESYATYYENYPSITAISVAYDVLKHEAELSERVKEILTERSILMSRMIEEAQKNGQIRPDVKCGCIADIILGSSREICLKWRMENYSFSLKERVLYTVNAILDSFSLK